MADKTAAGKSETEKKINFSVLQKHDREIENIIDTASSVAHYRFNANSGVWEKTEVEGSLFLYSRSKSPFIVIFIMNRLSKENTKLMLTADMEIQIQQPFLLCKLRNNEIIGIWFYDETECQRFGNLLKKLSMLCKDETKLKIAIMMEIQKQKEDKEQKKPTKPKGIVSMFNKAQEEYIAKNAGRSPSPAAKNKQQQQKKMHNQQQQSTTKPASKKTNENHQTKQTSEKKRQQPKLSPSAVRRQERQDEMKRQQESFQESHRKEQDLLLSILHGGKNENSNRQRTMSTSNTVGSNIGFDINHFSSQAGDLAITGGAHGEGDQHGANKSGVIPKVIGCAELESELIRNRNKTANDLPGPRSHEIMMREVKSFPNLRHLEERQAKPPDSIDLQTTPKGDGKRSRLPFTGAASVPIEGPVSLLSPSVMAATSRSGGVGRGRGASINLLNNQKISIAANFGTASSSSGSKIAKKLFSDDLPDEDERLKRAPSTSMLNSLMSPAAFLQPTNPTMTSSNSEQTEPPVMLTKDQFQQAFIQVLQTDDNFVTVLHQAYLEQANKT